MQYLVLVVNECQGCLCLEIAITVKVRNSIFFIFEKRLRRCPLQSQLDSASVHAENKNLLTSVYFQSTYMLYGVLSERNK